MIKLFIECSCGFKKEIEQYDDVWRIKEGFRTDSGTSFPTEIWLHCPKCKQEKEYLS